MGLHPGDPNMTPAEAKKGLLDWSAPSPTGGVHHTDSAPPGRGRRVCSRLVSTLRLMGTAVAVADACRAALSRDDADETIHPEEEEREHTMRQSMNTKRGHAAAADTMTNLRSDVATVVKDVTDLVGSRFDAASNRTRALIDGTRDRAVAAHERIAEFAGERPLTTIAISAAAGVVALKVIGLLRGRH